jgi:two-component system, chemotaxis family, protein-glutamate methylesterase/glutaminase
MSAGVHNEAGRAPFDVLVVAASLGGPAALGQVLAGLPADFPAAVLIVQHRTLDVDDRFTAAVRGRTAMPVRAARDGQPLAAAGISVLPARHTGTVTANGTLRLEPGTGYRLADPLICSVAGHCGPRALCLVLTGRLDDAAAGVRALKRHGGRSIVQDPVTARAPQMPSAALATGCVDLVMPLPHIAPALVALTMAPGAADLFRVPPSPWANFAA